MRPSQTDRYDEPDTEDPNGSWQTRPAEPDAMYSPAPEDEMDDGRVRGRDPPE